MKRTLLGLGLALVQAVAMAAPQRIADAWYAHNAVLLMLGGADQLVATVARPQGFPWMYRVAPGMRRALSIDGATMNAEELLRLHTDTVFVTPSDPSAASLARAGLHVVPVGFTDFASMLDCVDLTARTLGTPFAQRRATGYRAYLAQTLADVRAIRAVGAPPRVLHVASLNPLKIDGDHTIVDEWIKAAGGRNAARGLHGNLQTVSIEQVLAWRPDVIILAANAGAIAASPQAALWASLPAVQRRQVFRNPSGVFPWDRYGPEVALQVRWAAGILHPAPQRAARSAAARADAGFLSTLLCVSAIKGGGAADRGGIAATVTRSLAFHARQTRR